MQRIYLDNAATTEVAPEVLASMQPYLSSIYGNPSSLHHFGRAARQVLETARKQVAGILGVRPSTIIFTCGGTESNNTVIGTAANFVDRIITSPTEHHAVLHPVEKGTTPYALLETDEYGKPDTEHLESLLQGRKEKTLVSIMAANNETGVLADIGAIAAICEKHGALFHTDAVQYIGHYPIDLSKIAISYASASGHKFHGPKGTGILYVREGATVLPLIHGGGQERGIRSGTENLAGIVGFAKALELATANHETNRRYVLNLRSYLKKEIKAIIPAASFNEIPGEEGLYSVLSMSVPLDQTTVSLTNALDLEGIAVSGGSACSAGASSHVMKALGKADGYETIRFSFSHFNKAEEIIKVLRALKNIFHK